MPDQASSSPAIETLYCDHHGWLQGWLRGKLGNAVDAADLAHDTFLRVLGKREAAGIREPRAYLRTIAHGLVVNHWRRQDIERAVLETLAAMPPEHAPSPEDRALLVDVLSELDALLDRLNPKARAAFLLAQLDGLTYLEIARRLQVSERMVKKYMAQAMMHCLTSGLRADAAVPR